MKFACGPKERILSAIASGKIAKESLILTSDDKAVDNQFVTVVKETNGVVAVTRRGLTAADIPALEMVMQDSRIQQESNCYKVVRIGV